MTKEQVIQFFWSSFGLPAYDENTVPETATMPYITYESKTDSLGNVVSLSASLWWRSKSWKDISEKADEINNYLSLGGKMIGIKNGSVWIQRGSPFSQRVPDPDDSIRRININIQVEFISA